MSPEPDPYYVFIGPMKDALLGLVDAREAAQASSGGIPAATSAAMAELADEPKWTGTWGDEPLQQAHSIAGLRLAVAEDCIRSIGRLLDSDPPVIFAHMLIARSALELSARSWWLDELGIGHETRIARTMTERIYNFREQAKVPADVIDETGRTLAQRADDGISAIVDEAVRRGIHVNAARTVVGGHARPGSTQSVRSLIEVMAGDEIDVVVYRYFSAIEHGTSYGLVQSVEWQAAGPFEPQSVRLTSKASTVTWVLAGLVLGYGHAAEVQLEHRGWDRSTFTPLHKAAVELSVKHLPTE